MAPGRREIGHGALGERALRTNYSRLKKISHIPFVLYLKYWNQMVQLHKQVFVRGTLAMMDAGVPIKAPVAGIAMGLVKSGEYYTILTDIQGMEDHLGDMDFKVAGTAKGVTALQMDIKIDGLSREILEEALQQAKKGRMQILESYACNN